MRNQDIIFLPLLIDEIWKKAHPNTEGFNKSSYREGKVLNDSAYKEARNKITDFFPEELSVDERSFVEKTFPTTLGYADQIKKVAVTKKTTELLCWYYYGSSNQTYSNYEDFKENYETRNLWGRFIAEMAPEANLSDIEKQIREHCNSLELEKKKLQEKLDLETVKRNQLQKLNGNIRKMLLGGGLISLIFLLTGYLLGVENGINQSTPIVKAPETDTLQITGSGTVIGGILKPFKDSSNFQYNCTDYGSLRAIDNLFIDKKDIAVMSDRLKPETLFRQSFEGSEWLELALATDDIVFIVNSNSFKGFDSLEIDFYKLKQCLKKSIATGGSPISWTDLMEKPPSELVGKTIDFIPPNSQGCETSGTNEIVKRTFELDSLLKRSAGSVNIPGICEIPDIVSKNPFALGFTSKGCIDNANVNIISIRKDGSLISMQRYLWIYFMLKPPTETTNWTSIERVSPFLIELMSQDFKKYGFRNIDSTLMNSQLGLLKYALKVDSQKVDTKWLNNYTWLHSIISDKETRNSASAKLWRNEKIN